MFQPKIGFAKFKGAMLLGLMALLFLAVMAPGTAMANTYNLNPVADAATDIYARDQNFGDDVLWVYDGRSYLRFDLSAIPDNYTISQAALHLYCSYAVGTITIDLHFVATDTWQEYLINYNNAPNYGSNLDSQSSSEIGWRVFNLFGVTGAWNWSGDLTDNAVSLLIKDHSEGPVPVYQFFGSKEYGLKPYLEITASSNGGGGGGGTLPAPPAVFLLGSGLLCLGLAGARRKFGK